MNALYAHFGLQGRALATLPDLKRYQLFKQKEKGLITLDIQKELAILAGSPSSTLSVTVPTLGFTDPLLDYSPAPRFAFPVSINGFVADEDNHSAAKAAVFGTDLANNQYPLLRDQQNRVNYPLIQAQHNGTAIYSTLRAITYMFQSESILHGNHLAKIAHPELKGMMEFWLCYPTKMPLTFTLTVKDKQGLEVLSRKMCYYPMQSTLSQASFQGNTLIHCEAKVSDPFHFYRASWVCDVEGINSSLRLTHHAGLSYPFMRALLEHLIPQAHFVEIFSRKNHKQLSLNRYDSDAALQSVFYHHVIDSIINQSLPLMAMQDFFIPDAHDADKLKAISKKFDDQDQLVFKRSQRLPSLDAFVDALDELIALRDPLFAAQLQLPTDQDNDHIKSLQVSLSLEDKEGQWSRISALHQPEIQEDISTFSRIANVNQYRGLRRK